MDGFGASDSFLGPLSDAQISLFFDPANNNGIALSILRGGIDETGQPNGGTWSNLQRAYALGVRIWAAPWSPPGNWKSNGSDVNGGDLLSAHYTDWANVLVGYINAASGQGVNLYALSAQNEPDYTASYVSCIYSGSEMASFIETLGPLVAALNPRPKLMMPETSVWNNMWGFTSAVEADPTASSYTDIYATHQYAGYTSPQSNAKPIWETEFSTFDGFDPSINNGISVAQTIHQAITTGGVQAWHYWWLIGQNSDNEGLIGSNSDPAGQPTMTKRLYTMGNFSKFVRPGFVRIGTSNEPSGVLMTAYRNPSGSTFAIVAINTNGADTPITFALNNLQASSVTPWITSATFDLAAQPSVTVSGNVFSTTLPATSVTTLVSSP
jgi:glucuronoarabinoxylan endo-1,4-beta-xylanase